MPYTTLVRSEEGWIPKAGKALGGGDPQEAGRGSLLGPVRKDKKTIDLVDIQSASVSAQAKEKAYLVQVRTFYFGERACASELVFCPRGLPAPRALPGFFRFLP